MSQARGPFFETGWPWDESVRFAAGWIRAIGELADKMPIFNGVGISDRYAVRRIDFATVLALEQVAPAL
jgi:hypothetical protein